VTTINKDVWDKLTPEQQKALETASEECQAFLWSEVKKVVAENDQFCYDNGVTPVPVSNEFHDELVKAGETVAADWLDSNKNAVDAIALYNEFMEAKGKK
jgi:TRAP-type C4-dicarboxylate transport system substrate-binding protein